MDTFNRALVLGSGGRAGTAWLAGLACGLRGAGIDLGEADLTVGTSAGAIVGALLAAGQDPGRLADPVRPAGGSRPAGPPPRPGADPALVAAVFAVLGEPGLPPEEARRQVGRLVLEHTDPEAEQALVAQRATLIGAEHWPERGLLITGVDAGTGEPVVWGRASGVPLARAVAASSAFPGFAAPVAIDGRWYIDGALRSGTNADLAVGARTLVVLEPMAHTYPREALQRELAAVGARTVVTVGPDAASVRALGNPADTTTWGPSYQAGLRQAADTAEQLREAWTAAADPD